MALLEIKNLVKSYDGIEVLKGINFDLEEGETLSIIGASGNGKTTILRCLNGLTKIDSGEIIIDNKNINPFNDSSDFSLVFQNYNLFPQYTALENVLLGINTKTKNDIKKLKISIKEKRELIKNELIKNKEKCEDILIKIGLKDKLNNYPIELSGGEQQRVAIARALALSPKILCFDEPTSALDPVLTKEVISVIKELKKENKTMIIVSHDMTFVKEISDKVIFLSNGNIIEKGLKNEIFNNPKNELTKAFLLKEIKKEE